MRMAYRMTVLTPILLVVFPVDIAAAQEMECDAECQALRDAQDPLADVRAITAIREAEKAYPGKERRTQIIHAQLFNDDQMKAVAQLDATVIGPNCGLAIPDRRLRQRGTPMTASGGACLPSNGDLGAIRTHLFFRSLWNS